MTTVTYSFNVGSTVFHVNAETGIREAIVSSVTISVKSAGTVISYGIAYKKSKYGTAVVEESVLYDDIDAALLAYKPLVDV